MKGIFVICFLIFLRGLMADEASYGAHGPPGFHQSLSGQGWPDPQPSPGSYYHYHVPVVGHSGQYQQPPPPAPSSHSKLHEILLWILPLILVGIGPVLFLPFLLKLFLLPLGLSLLGLLLPLLMMGGMMMMMMMSGGMMMMPMRNQPTAVTTARALANFAFQGNWTDLSRAFNLDNCPEKLFCELGTMTKGVQGLDSMLELSRTGPLRTFRSKNHRILEAFEHGLKSGDCDPFSCKPIRFQNSTVTSTTLATKVHEINSSPRPTPTQSSLIVSRMRANGTVSRYFI